MTPLDTIGRYWRTVRPLTAGQMACRARFMLRRGLGWYPHPVCPEHTPEFSTHALERLRDLARAWPVTDPNRAEVIRRGELTFAGQTVDCAKGLPWDRSDLPRLWRYHLHGFDHLLPLALDPAPEDGARVKAWMQDWVHANPIGADVAWDPYPVAQRLMHWGLAAAVFDLRGEELRRSLWQQARYLERSLEYDLRANHLLQNAAGLVVAGSLLDEAVLARGLQVLEVELGEQILEDGGHYERSPMYHCHALWQCLLAYAALPEKPAFLRKALERMTAFLGAVCHADGEIPLFGDAALGAAIPPRVLIALVHALTGAESPGPLAGGNALEASGFYALGPADASARMLVKAGAAGPGYQLGHAHCDLLSYELTQGAARVIVDSGVHGYAGSPWREYCRSTRAHNTVSVNGLEQMECWGVFRVGRRYTAVREFWGDTEDGQVLRVRHDGFRPFRHQRTVAYARDGQWTITDVVEGPSDFEVESYIHLHPDYDFKETTEGWEIAGTTPVLLIVPFGQESAKITQGVEHPRQGWYCPRFGAAEPAATLVLRARGASKVTSGYDIVPSLKESSA